MTNQKPLRLAATFVVAGLGIFAFTPAVRSADDPNHPAGGTAIGQPASGLNNTNSTIGASDRSMDTAGIQGNTLDAASKAQIQTAIGKLVDDATTPSRFNALIQDLSLKNQQRLEAKGQGTAENTNKNAATNNDQGSAQLSQATVAFRQAWRDKYQAPIALAVDHAALRNMIVVSGFSAGEARTAGERFGNNLQTGAAETSSGSGVSGSSSINNSSLPGTSGDTGTATSSLSGKGLSDTSGSTGLTGGSGSAGVSTGNTGNAANTSGRPAGSGYGTAGIGGNTGSVAGDTTGAGVPRGGAQTTNTPSGTGSSGLSGVAGTDIGNSSTASGTAASGTTSGNINRSTGIYDRSASNMNDHAIVMLPAQNGAPAARLHLVKEGGNWKVSVPDSMDRQQLEQNLQTHLTELTNKKDQWPADRQQAEAMIAQHVLLALSGSGNEMGTQRERAVRSGTGSYNNTGSYNSTGSGTSGNTGATNSGSTGTGSSNTGSTNTGSSGVQR